MVQAKEGKLVGPSVPFHIWKTSRTKTPLPSLVVSFAILHEVTAIVPLVSIFFAAKTFGLGEKAVQYVRRENIDGKEPNWMQKKSEEWLNEGEEWTGRIGRRYGIFGYPKTLKGSVVQEKEHQQTDIVHNIAGDVANAVLAYGATKALVPVRIGLSMYLAPAFSRRILDPIRKRIMNSWRKSP
ncbi:hypothetical protein M422DRAFT_77099 [Sphaerobolus stellatus SS14]|uniref:Uncharacterized protein n=1 Tax=Sphaerobolus stellatus (strain SS14) TaxID=990650 RepID=A0A0C9UJD6_SPHS4|nr:hypothetical protein M422DRAFT_77099 [Sphaerobolus stellatus SS14]